METKGFVMKSECINQPEKRLQHYSKLMSLLYADQKKEKRHTGTGIQMQVISSRIHPVYGGCLFHDRSKRVKIYDDCLYQHLKTVRILKIVSGECLNYFPEYKTWIILPTD